MEGSNVLEGSKDCRSVGGHGNQHVRLRSAQISLSGVTCPVQEANFAFEAGAQCGCGYVAPVRPQKITRRPQTAAEPGAAPMSGPIGNRLKLCPKGVGAAALLSLRLKISGPYGAG